MHPGGFGEIIMFDNVYAGKKVLVTGNTGFKGSWLTTWLLKLGAEVIGISDRIPTNPSMFEVLHLQGKIKFFQIDIRNLSRICEIVESENPDYIFHLAAQAIVSVSYENPIETISTNVLGTAAILEALRCFKKECIAVIITSDKCYDNVEWCWGYRELDSLGGKDPYGASKSAAEMVIKAYYHSFFKNNGNIRVVSVRAGNVIGGGDWASNRIVPDCIKAWTLGQKVDIRNPLATRPWQHVLEPLSGYLRVGQMLKNRDSFSGQAYNFGPTSDQTYTVLELLKQIGSSFCSSNIQDKFEIKQNSAYHEAGLLKLNCDKALYDLAWLPTLDFKHTAQFTAEWYNNFYQNQIDMFDFTMNQIERYGQIATEIGREWTN